jgi:hypothetical protein
MDRAKFDRVGAAYMTPAGLDRLWEIIHRMETNPKGDLDTDAEMAQRFEAVRTLSLNLPAHLGPFNVLGPEVWITKES